MTKRREHNARLKPSSGRASRRPLAAGLAFAALALALFGLAAWGVRTVCGSLGAVCDEQCRIDDADLDVVVTVTPGKMVQGDVIPLHFGLTNGANLAAIDFAALRRKFLRRVPNVRELKIERRLPNRVTIDVTEREPLARVASVAKGGPQGLMTDAEGVVFRFARAAATYPVVRLAADQRMQPGDTLRGRAAAALRLLEEAAQPEFISLNVQEADATYRDYLLITLGNYARAKIAWEHMDDATARARASLRRQLTRLKQALSTNLASPTATWMVTDYGTPGRVYAAENDR